MNNKLTIKITASAMLLVTSMSSVGVPINVLANDMRIENSQKINSQLIDNVQSKPENLLGDASFHLQRINPSSTFFKYSNWDFQVGNKGGYHFFDTPIGSDTFHPYRDIEGNNLVEVQASDGREVKMATIQSGQHNRDYDPNREYRFVKKFKTTPGKFYKVNLEIKSSFGTEDSASYSPYVTDGKSITEGGKIISEKRVVVVPGKVGKSYKTMEVFFKATGEEALLNLAGSGGDQGLTERRMMIYSNPEVYETSEKVKSAYDNLRNSYKDEVRLEPKNLKLEDIKKLLQSIEDISYSQKFEINLMGDAPRKAVVPSVERIIAGWFTSSEQTELNEDVTLDEILEIESIIKNNSGWFSSGLNKSVEKAKGFFSLELLKRDVRGLFTDKDSTKLSKDVNRSKILELLEKSKQAPNDMPEKQELINLSYKALKIYTELHLITPEKLGNQKWLIDEVNKQIPFYNVGDDLLTEDIVEIKEIMLANKSISGILPDQISTVSNLEKLDLSGNSIAGSVSGSITNLKKLKSLNLENTQITNNSKDPLIVDGKEVSAKGTFMVGTGSLKLISNSDISVDSETKVIRPFDPSDNTYFNIREKSGVKLLDNHTYKIIEKESKKVVFEGKADVNAEFPIPTGTYSDAETNLYRDYEVIMDGADKNPNSVTEVNLFVHPENYTRNQLLKNTSFTPTSNQKQLENWKLKTMDIKTTTLGDKTDEGLYTLFTGEGRYLYNGAQLEPSADGLSIHTVYTKPLSGTNIHLTQELTDIIKGRTYSLEGKVKSEFQGNGKNSSVMYYLGLESKMESNGQIHKSDGSTITVTDEFVATNTAEKLQLRLVQLGGEHLVNFTDLVVKEKYADQWKAVDGLFVDLNHDKVKENVTPEQVAKVTAQVDKIENSVDKTNMKAALAKAKG